MEAVGVEQVGEELLGAIVEGRYRLEEVLGSGASGVVYLATQLAVDRRVAVKLLHESDDPEFQARFEVEARAIARLNHKNCITLHDFGHWVEGETYYMVTEYIGGEGLADRMMDFMPVDFVIHLLLDVAQALNHAHGNNILHRDLKPENIMLSKTDQRWENAKVLDFGLAHILDSGNMRLTPIGGLPVANAGTPRVVHGTPIYMSPEQCNQVAELTAATDIYSLGVLAFELLEGRVPFDGATAEELFELHIHKSAPPITNPEVPANASALVESMLAKDPLRRPSAREVIDELRSQVSMEMARDGWENEDFVFEEVGDDASESFELVEIPSPSNNRRVLLVVGVVGLLALFVVAFLVFGSDDPDTDAVTNQTGNQTTTTTTTAKKTAPTRTALGAAAATRTPRERVKPTASVSRLAVNCGNCLDLISLLSSYQLFP